MSTIVSKLMINTAEGHIYISPPIFFIFQEGIKNKEVCQRVKVQPWMAAEGMKGACLHSKHSGKR